MKSLLKALRLTAIAGAAFLLTPQVVSGEDNSPRGTPNTDERAVYCAERQAQCVTNGQASCRGRFPQTGADRLNCYRGAALACNNAFGTDSDCRTAELSVPTPPLNERPTTHEPGPQTSPGRRPPPRRPTRTDRNANGIPDAQERGAR